MRNNKSVVTLYSPAVLPCNAYFLYPERYEPASQYHEELYCRLFGAVVNANFCVRHKPRSLDGIIMSPYIMQA